MANDQTHPDWLQSWQDLGTGILSLPVHVLGGESRNYRILYAPDVTYADCIQLAWTARAFQWVPHRVMLFAEVLNADCGGTCTIRCPPGCLCEGGTCVKR